MIYVLYTTSDQIRAVAGLSEEDVADSVIQARDMELELKVDLYQWLPNHDVLQADTSTTQAQFISDSIQLYTAYRAAVMLLRSPMLILQKVGDGSNTAERFAIDPAATADALQAEADKLRGVISNVLVPPTTTVPVKFFSIDTPSYDPVVG